MDSHKVNVAPALGDFNSPNQSTTFIRQMLIERVEHHS
jgi:hypothetical protein